MKKQRFLIILLFATSLCFGQKRDLSPFTTINAFGPFEIELIKADKEAIEMDAVNVDKEDLMMEVRRGELQLKLKSRHYMTDWNSDKFRKTTLIKTKIYFKQLEEVTGSAGAKITSNETLRSKKFMVLGAMGAELKLNIVAETIHAKTSMGATVNISGRSNFLEVKASMGGVLKASHLESKSAYVRASMGSEVFIFASDEIDIDANFGADVKYTGDPSVRHTNRKMGADISKK